MENNKKNKKRNILITIIQIILVVIILYSAYSIGDYYYQNYKNTKNLEKVNNLVNNIENEVNKELDIDEKIDHSKLTKEQLDFIAKKTIERLKLENSDIYAFVKAPDFKINNPVTWLFEDNDYYVFRDLEGNSSRPGTIFMNGWNNPDFSDMNITFFGHNLRTHPEFYAPMFKMLLTLEDKEVVMSRDKHIVEVYTENGYKKYMMFSAYYTNIYDDYISPNRDKSEWVDYLQTLQLKSINDFGLNLQFKEDDRILTLSTCDNVLDEGRFVVHAIELKDKDVQNKDNPEWD